MYHFEAGDLEIPYIYFFREIFKFLEDKSNNVFREILQCFRKTEKFERNRIPKVGYLVVKMKRTYFALIQNAHAPERWYLVISEDIF